MNAQATIEQRERLIIVGNGMVGHHCVEQLIERGARLIRVTRTAPSYRFFALPGSAPPKPGLVRVNRFANQHCLELLIPALSVANWLKKKQAVSFIPSTTLMRLLMKDIHVQSKVAMAKTLHAHGVNLPYIAVATGLTPRKIRSELKLAIKNKINKRKL